MLAEQRQSRPSVVPLHKGDGVVFAVNHRPVRGSLDEYRVTLRTGYWRRRHHDWDRGRAWQEHQLQRQANEAQIKAQAWQQQQRGAAQAAAAQAEWQRHQQMAAAQAQASQQLQQQRAQALAAQNQAIWQQRAAQQQAQEAARTRWQSGLAKWYQQHPPK